MPDLNSFLLTLILGVLSCYLIVAFFIFWVLPFQRVIGGSAVTGTLTPYCHLVGVKTKKEDFYFYPLELAQ